MKLIRHYVASFVIFAMLAGLIYSMDNEIKTTYEVNETYTGMNESNEENIAERIHNMGLVTRLDKIGRGLAKITNPTSLTDILGGIMLTGFSALILVMDVVFLPLEIIGIITQFYFIPDIIKVGFMAIILIYIGFIYRSAQMRGEV